MSQPPPNAGEPLRDIDQPAQPPADEVTPAQPQPLPAQAVPPIRTGVTVGRHQIQEYLGQGAYGPNYRAYDPNLARSATIEVLDALRDQDVRDRLAAAAPRLVELRHSNLVDVYEVGERQGVPYLVSGYVEGVALGDAMRGGISQEGALRLLQGVARAVDHVHWHGVVHGDLRPATIMIGAEGRPLVRDAGLIPLLDAGFRGAALGIRTGSLHYQAPEQLERGEVNAATDRYSFTTIAYQLLTGSLPFPGNTTSEILSAKERMDPLPASSRNPQVGPATSTVLASGLARDPDARWQSCAQIVQALGQAINDDAWEAQAAYAAEHPAARAPAAAPARQRWPWVLAAVAGLILLALGGLLWFNSQQQAPSINLSDSSVRPGDSVLVTASHLPANQIASVEFQSSPITLTSVQADQYGNASVRATVPKEASAGVHQISLCWSGSCPAGKQITVLEPLPSPTPPPTATPTPTPTPPPTPTPTLPPTHTPTPTPSPSPTSTR